MTMAGTGRDQDRRDGREVRPARAQQQERRRRLTESRAPAVAERLDL